MKTLTVRQPFAWAIARGHKPIENRGWTTEYRGPLAIHAAKKWDDGGEHTLREVVHLVRAQGGHLPKTPAHDMPYFDIGLVIATVDLIDICRKSLDADPITCDYSKLCDCGPWAQPGQAHWKFTRARVLAEPITARGRLMLWDCEVPT